MKEVFVVKLEQQNKTEQNNKQKRERKGEKRNKLLLQKNNFNQK